MTNRQWNIAPGTYELKIGASSQDIRLKQQIVLTGDKVVKPLRDHRLDLWGRYSDAV